MTIEWQFESIRKQLDRLEQSTVLRQVDDSVEIVDRQTGKVLRVVETVELLVWWERLAYHVDSLIPPSLDLHAD